MNRQSTLHHRLIVDLYVHTLSESQCAITPHAPLILPLAAAVTSMTLSGWPLVSQNLVNMSGFWAKRLSNLSLAHWMVCSMVAGKDLRVQYGTSLSGGSCCEEDDERRGQSNIGQHTRSSTFTFTFTCTHSQSHINFNTHCSYTHTHTHLHTHTHTQLHTHTHTYTLAQRTHICCRN